MATMSLVGCGQGGFDRAAAIESFGQANPETTATERACVVDRLIDRYDVDGLESELANDEPSVEFVEAQFRDMFACGVEGDVESQIADQLGAAGVGAEHTPCVAETLAQDLDDGDIDVLLSGDITEQFFDKFYSAMDRCGALET